MIRVLETGLGLGHMHPSNCLTLSHKRREELESLIILLATVLIDLIHLIHKAKKKMIREAHAFPSFDKVRISKLTNLPQLEW